ncbi:MAG TPA: hypothetical protein VFB90_03015 [Dehalococcoidia bacterium]|nr:hypothetical protein [Dehalococcoidia bacterium]
MSDFESEKDLSPLDEDETKPGRPPEFIVEQPRAASVVAEALQRMTATMEVEDDDTGLLPAQPRSFQQLGLSRAFLTDLALKIIHYSGTPTAAQISRRMGISSSLIQQLLSMLSEEKVLEPMGQADLYSGSYRYRLTARGTERVQEALERSRYAGPVPVPVDRYSEVIRRQVGRRHLPARWRIKESLAGVVLADEVEDAAGRALYSGRSALLYGPSGNGKTSIFQSFTEHIDGITIMPYAIYAHGQVIRVFDPTIHLQADDAEAEANTREDRFDHRWVVIRRPVILVGPELNLDTLDLAYDPLTRFYQAPPQIKAQGGVLIIDDLGRQKVEAPVVLSRLLIPLERGWDTLTLATGEKVTLPLSLQFLFGTNLAVNSLADDSMLRRIPYKVEIPSPGSQEFTEILGRLLQEWHIEASQESVSQVVEKLYSQSDIEPRAAHAGDLLQIIVESAQFDGRQPVLDVESFEKALNLFVMERKKFASGS